MNRTPQRDITGTLDDQYVAPPITGDPYSLRRRGQSRGEAMAMWAGYLLAYAATRLALFTAIGLVLYPMALTIQWLRILAG